MALNNPINFFRTDEKNALLTKEKTVGNNITTTSVTFVDKPDTSSKEAIAKNEATGGGAIFIEGKKIIQGVSVLEKQYLWDQLAEKEFAKYSAELVSVKAMATTTDFSCVDIPITFVFKAKYNSEGTDKVSSQTIGKNVGNEVVDAKPGTPVGNNIGQYSSTIACKSSNTGYQSVSVTFSFTYGDTGYGRVTKTASASWSHQAMSVIISTNTGLTAPKSTDIVNATIKKVGVQNFKSFATTSGKDMWICVPKCDNYKQVVTEKGIEIAFTDAQEVDVNGTIYLCRRKSATPTDVTGTINFKVIK